MRIATLFLAFTLASCAVPQKWMISAQLDRERAKNLLSQADPGDLDSELLTKEVPVIPMPMKLRPCCIMGDNARVRIGPVPVPFFRLPNTRGPEDLGEHAYGSGFVRTVRSGRTDLAFDPENNGLVYTCHGGFVDTAHMREWADWTLFFTAALCSALETGTEIDYPNGSIPIRIVLTPIQKDLVLKIGFRRLSVALAQWVSFNLSMWHEIETWYGAHSIPGWSEEASAFSPEDMFSNILGMRITAGIIFHRGAESEVLYNEAVGNWIQGVLGYLAAVPEPLSQQAIQVVDGLWWDSEAHLPDKNFILRRNFQFDSQQGWQVPPIMLRAPHFSELRAACGDAPKPVKLVVLDSLDGHKFEDWITIHFELSKQLAKQKPFLRYGTSITQKDLPDIVSAIRDQNEEEFGEGADRPY